MLKAAPASGVNNLFSHTHVTEARRSRAWLDDRLARGSREIFSETIDLAPVLAEMLLERNPANRTLRPAAVEAYRTDIINGDWALNGESIKIASDGLLNDGQHRCNAVVAAGRSIKTVITFGVGRDTRMTVDQGAVRTAGNFLAMSGAENSNQAAAVASFIWQIEQNNAFATGGHSKPTKTQISESYFAHKDAIDASVKAIPSGSRVGHSRSILAFCHYLTAKVAPREADYFFLRLCLGDGLTRRDPVYHAREKLLNDRRMSAGQKAELIIRAWNATRRHRPWTKCGPIIGELPAVER